MLGMMFASGRLYPRGGGDLEKKFAIDEKFNTKTNLSEHLKGVQFLFKIGCMKLNTC